MSKEPTPELDVIKIPGGQQYRTPDDVIHGTVFVKGTDQVFARCPRFEDAETIRRAVNRDHAFDGLINELKFVAGHAKMAISNNGVTEKETIKHRTESLENLMNRALKALAAAGVKVGE